MIFIRRAVDKQKTYTVIMLPGEPPKWIPTTDYEHQRILEIYKQDKYYEGIENDFTEFKKLFPKIELTLEQYTKDAIRVKTNSLKSILDKEKNRPKIDTQYDN